MGQGIAQDLVAAVGPVSFDGNTLDASNTADFLAKGIYAKYQDVSAKNQAVQKFMVALMAAAKQNKPNLMGLLTEVYESNTGDHISIWSADSAQQAWNMSHRIAGSVSTAKNQDVTVAVNNGGGNKLEAYLHMDAVYGLCMAKDQSHFSLKLGNTAPRVGLPAYVVGRYDLGPKDSYVVGSNLENVTVYLPIGAQIASLLVDGESYGAGSYVDRGHQILVFDIPINPGQHRVIDIDWQPAKTAGAASQEPRVLMSPQFNRPGIRASASCN